MNQFLQLGDLGIDTIRSLLRRAEELRHRPIADTLRDKVIALVFMNPSLRTLTSFQSGIAQLGGNSIVIAPGQQSWGFEWRDGVVMDGAHAEHVREAFGVLSSYCDAVGIRCFGAGEDLAVDLAEPVLGAIANATTQPLFNMESAVRHPCQALADWKTLDDLGVPESGGRFLLSWASHPKPLPLAVPSSTLLMAAQRGMDVTLCCPDGYDLPEAVLNQVRENAPSFRISRDIREGADDADVIYAKSWGSPQDFGNADAELDRRAEHSDWCCNEQWFDTAQPNARFLHCLPIRRGVVAADEILDGPRSAVQLQAANRLHVQKSMLEHLLQGKLS